MAGRFSHLKTVTTRYCCLGSKFDDDVADRGCSGLSFVSASSFGMPILQISALMLPTKSPITYRSLAASLSSGMDFTLAVKTETSRTEIREKRLLPTMRALGISGLGWQKLVTSKKDDSRSCLVPVNTNGWLWPSCSQKVLDCLNPSGFVERVVRGAVLPFLFGTENFRDLYSFLYTAKKSLESQSSCRDQLLKYSLKSKISATSMEMSSFATSYPLLLGFFLISAGVSCFLIIRDSRLASRAVLYSSLVVTPCRTLKDHPLTFHISTRSKWFFRSLYVTLASTFEKIFSGVSKMTSLPFFKNCMLENTGLMSIFDLRPSFTFSMLMEKKQVMSFVSTFCAPTTDILRRKRLRRSSGLGKSL
mmetsp:Transcript_8185/g.20221  ORF Transcript_8185/g.20221 Transcript_8185/m.20221 type:complete len:362 (-) Transcript_8185:211-1296(-)